MTNTRALISHRLQGSVAERIKHEAFNILAYRRKSSNPVRSRYFNSPQSLMFRERPALALK